VIGWVWIFREYGTNLLVAASINEESLAFSMRKRSIVARNIAEGSKNTCFLAGFWL